jgi:type VI secretion system secreted protein VgrG
MATATLGPINITPLAGNELFFRSLSGDEAMGALFEYTVQFVCKNPDIPLAKALGQNMTVSVPLSRGGLRHFNGFITRFSSAGASGSHFLYRAVLHPWTWFLGRSADCRIFPNQSVPQIVKRVLTKHPEHRIAEGLLAYPSREYPVREYLVQYRETDLNFVSRLMEHAGIGYHFVHKLGEHTLFLTDPSSARESAPGYENIAVHSAAETGLEECFTSWHVSQEVEPAAYMLKDYDYTNPKAPLVAQIGPNASDALIVQGEIYDYPGQYSLAEYPGRYTASDVRDTLAGTRLQQSQSYYETVEAQGTVRGVGVGHVFKREGFHPTSGDPRFLIIKAHYEVHGHGPEAAAETAGDEETFRCSITAVDARRPFRPARLTPIPVVQGPHTAVVVGPDKEKVDTEEIWTDEQGRILVKFHWERLGSLKPKDPFAAEDPANKEENKPCWLRVAQTWAGATWGAVFIPRIGQEVMVEFLEGDPDRPIVTGRVYNQDNKPPYLDAEHGRKHQSGIRSHSTPKGGPKNYNEIRFDDKKDAEELYIQAEKNQLNKIKHNRTADVGAGDTITVGGSRTVTVKGNMTTTVKGGGDGSPNNFVDVTGDHKLNASKKIDVKAETHIEFVCGDSVITIEPGKITLKAGGKAMIILDADAKIQSEKESKLVLDADVLLKASTGAEIGMNAVLTAKGKSGGQVVLDADAKIDGGKVVATGKSEATVAGGSSSVKVDNGGVVATGTEVKLNA